MSVRCDGVIMRYYVYGITTDTEITPDVSCTVATLHISWTKKLKSIKNHVNELSVKKIGSQVSSHFLFFQALFLRPMDYGVNL